MTLACGAAADWYGWSAGALALAAGLLLARPLFLLLRHREALDALVQALESGRASEDLQQQFADARRDLSVELYLGRKSWKRWAYPGVALLFAAVVPLMLQFSCLV